MKKSLAIFLVLTAIPFFAGPVQSEPYLTKEQKELLLKDSRELELSKGKALAQNTSEQREHNNAIRQKDDPVKPRQTGPIYLGVTSAYHARTQSLQSIFNNADWGTPTYSDRSVNNRSVKPTRQIASTASGKRSFNSRVVKPTRQFASTASGKRSVSRIRQTANKAKKFNWSNFFKGLGQVAEAISSGMNQTTPQFNPYIPQPGNFSPQGNNQIINTMKVGNHTLNVGGDQEIHTWDVGNQTFGTFGGKKVKMHNFGNFSTGTIGDQKVRCHMAGNIKFCK